MVSLLEVMEVLRRLPNFRWANRADVMHIVEEDSGGGKRCFGVQGNRMRARYGHSLQRPIRYEACTPPPLLRHAP